jgi:hypothetical protein
LASAQRQSEKVVSSAQTYFSTLPRLSAAKDALSEAQAQIAENSTFTDDEQKAERSFGDMEVMFQRWVLFGNELVQFPPPLLQILLTFVSGLFGGLLVTLILIVYPSNEVKQKDARPVTRTFLGGFIAVCVYIILLSGTAVLGSANASTGAGTNYMAFCGIGILAGMYSDRVAGWLSERADEFFKPKQPPAGSGKRTDDQAPQHS